MRDGRGCATEEKRATYWYSSFFQTRSDVFAFIVLPSTRRRRRVRVAPLSPRPPPRVRRRAVQPVVLHARPRARGARTPPSAGAGLAVAQPRGGVAGEQQPRLASAIARLAGVPAHAATRRAPHGLELARDRRPREQRQRHAARRAGGELRGLPRRPRAGDGSHPGRVSRQTVPTRRIRGDAARGSRGSRPHPRRDRRRPELSRDPRTRSLASSRARFGRAGALWTRAYERNLVVRTAFRFQGVRHLSEMRRLSSPALAGRQRLSLSRGCHTRDARGWGTTRTQNGTARF